MKKNSIKSGFSIYMTVLFFTACSDKNNYSKIDEIDKKPNLSETKETNNNRSLAAVSDILVENNSNEESKNNSLEVENLAIQHDRDTNINATSQNNQQSSDAVEETVRIVRRPRMRAEEVIHMNIFEEIFRQAQGMFRRGGERREEVILETLKHKMSHLAIGENFVTYHRDMEIFLDYIKNTGSTQEGNMVNSTNDNLQNLVEYAPDLAFDGEIPTNIYKIIYDTHVFRAKIMNCERRGLWFSENFLGWKVFRLS